MGKRYWWAGTFVLLGFSCSGGDPSGSDGSGEGEQDTTRVPLQLLPAPPGLCSGTGTDKECDDPAGCQAPEGGDSAAAQAGTPMANTGMYAGTGASASSMNWATTAAPASGGTTSYTTPAASGGAASVYDPSVGDEADAPGAAGSAGAVAIGGGGAAATDGGGSTGAPALPIAGATSELDAAGAAGVSGSYALPSAGIAGQTQSAAAGRSSGTANPAQDDGASGSAASSDATGQAGAAGSPGAVGETKEANAAGTAGAVAVGTAGAEDPNATSGEACAGIDQDEPATLYLSADDSNSTAAPVIARSLIRAGQRVPWYVVRSYEFLNYYDFDFAPAEEGAMRIHPQLSSCPVDGELSFQVALQSEQRDPEDRAPLNVTFVLDTSGSMSGEPIALERAAVLAMAGELQEGDVVSMVTWSTDQQDVLSGHVVTGPDDPVVVSAATQLAANGGTDLHAGLVRGYALATQYASSDRINRVVLISDGQANVGMTDETLIGDHADDEEGEEGIYLTGIGVGDGVNDTLMNVVTDAGRGAYIYLDTVAEANKMLGERFLPSIDLAARHVRLELTLPWYMKVAKFYGEEISTDPTKVRPQHLGPNDAMLFFQILRACDASLIYGSDPITLRATWEEPFTRTSRQAVIEATLNDLAGNDADLAKAAAIAGYADALIEYDQLTDPQARLAVLREAKANVSAALEEQADADLEEIEELLTTYSATLP